ncbi:MAG: hypothetical protein AAGK23_08550 [Pseudomonadota bacterium]
MPIKRGDHWLSPQGPSEDGRGEGNLLNKLAWFAGLALASLIAVAATAYVLRGLLFI